MPAQLIDMGALKGESNEGTIAVLVQLLGDLCIGILLKEAIHGGSRLWDGQAGLGEGRRQRHRDGLCCSSLEANVGHNLIVFVDGHILNEEAHRSLALTHGRLGVSPELVEALWDSSYLVALLRAYLVLIALVVLFFNGSCLFQFTEFGIPFGF